MRSLFYRIAGLRNALHEISNAVHAAEDFNRLRDERHNALCAGRGLSPDRNLGLIGTR